MDFFYFVKCQDESQQGPPTIALGDSETGMLRARVLVSKGVTKEGVKTVTAFIELLGYKKVVIKADNEPAIAALRQESIRQFPYEVVKEMPPKYDSQCNGWIENIVLRVGGNVQDDQGRCGEQNRQKTIERK